MAQETPPLDNPISLNATHDRSGFDCGVAALNDFLQKFALPNQQHQTARTYVATRANRVVGYYTLAAGSVERETTTARLPKGLAGHPVPVLLLARFALDVSET